jgi:phosphatidylglycerophosphate synthase
MPHSTDDWIVTNIFNKHLYQACVLHIHPNTITLVALVMSLSIPFLHVHGFYPIVIIFIIARQLCDVLDGPVARECKQTSTIGGLLDTIADYIFGGAIVFLILHKFYGTSLFTVWVSILLPVLMLIITASVYSLKSLYDHSQFKGTNSIHDIFASHSMLVSILITIFYIFWVYGYKN